MERSNKPAYLQGCDSAQAGESRDKNPFDEGTADRVSWFEGFDEWTSEFGERFAKAVAGRTSAKSAIVSPANVVAWTEGQECAEQYGNLSQNPYDRVADKPAFDAWNRGFEKTIGVIRVPSQAPFKLDEEGENGVLGCRSIFDATGQEIATTTGLADDYQDWANARLFAAAPALLAVVRAFVAECSLGDMKQGGTAYPLEAQAREALALIDG